MIAAGKDADSANKLAAHLANRYAGVLSPEAMSPMARKLANVTMFSRSYTLGNIGAMKDMFVGMPRDMLAQIERDGGMAELREMRSYGQRKALGIVAVDMALFYAGNSIVQSAIEALKAETSNPEDPYWKRVGEVGQQEAKGYVERFEKALKTRMQHPMSALNPFAFLTEVGSTGGNEPGREDKILVGYQSDGTAVYVRNPTGKTGEEMIGWMTKPAQMMWNKSSTLVKPIAEVMNNQNFQGKKIYDPYPNTPQKAVSNMTAIIWHFMKAQVPSDMIEAGVDLLHGDPTKDEAIIDTLKVIGPIAGLMFSRGFPGGPAGGELFRAKQEQQFAIQQVMPDIRKDIKRGNLEEAQRKMTEVNIDPRLQKFFIDTTLNPSASFARRRMQQFMQTLPQEQQERIQEQFQKRKVSP